MRPVGAELFHVDGQTDTSMLIVAFRYFVNVPRKSIFCLHSVFLYVLYGPVNNQTLLLSTTLPSLCCNRDGEVY